MATKTTFIVQAFKRNRGRLVPGDREVAPTENGARKRAAAMATRMPGSAALCIVADDETGEVSTANIIETHGEIPDDFAERLISG